MNINESKAITEKLEELLKAAEEFGSQSRQLAEARGDFDQYLTAVQGNTEELGNVIKKCEEYIATAKELVVRDLSVQITEIVNGTEESVRHCKEHCEELTAEYERILNAFGEQRDVFEQKQDALCDAVDRGFEKTIDKVKTELKTQQQNYTESQREFVFDNGKRLDEILRKVSSAEEEITSQRSKALSACIQETKDACTLLKDRISETEEHLEQKNEELLEKTDNLTRTAINNKEALETEIQSIKEQQKKDHTLILVGLIASAVSALVSIIELIL